MAHCAVSNSEMCPPKADSARLRKTSGCAEAYWTYAAQANPQFDTEIAEKGHLWMETNQQLIFLFIAIPEGAAQQAKPTD